MNKMSSTLKIHSFSLRVVVKDVKVICQCCAHLVPTESPSTILSASSPRRGHDPVGMPNGLRQDPRFPDMVRRPRPSQALQGWMRICFSGSVVQGRMGLVCFDLDRRGIVQSPPYATRPFSSFRKNDYKSNCHVSTCWREVTDSL